MNADRRKVQVLLRMLYHPRVFVSPASSKSLQMWQRPADMAGGRSPCSWWSLRRWIGGVLFPTPDTASQTPPFLESGEERSLGLSALLVGAPGSQGLAVSCLQSLNSAIGVISVWAPC